MGTAATRALLAAAEEKRAQLEACERMRWEHWQTFNPHFRAGGIPRDVLPDAPRLWALQEICEDRECYAYRAHGAAGGWNIWYRQRRFSAEEFASRYRELRRELPVTPSGAYASADVTPRSIAV